jgi:hypothetical protein
MFMTVLSCVFLGLAVWVIVATLAALFLGRAARVLKHRRGLPEDTRVRVRGRRLHIVTHVD